MPFDTDHPITLTFMNPRTGVNRNDPDKANYITQECDDMYNASVLCRDLRAGKATMMSKANVYLPRFPNEDIEDYRHRLQLSSLRNYYAQACERIVGKVFSRPPMLNKDVPEAVRKDLLDADLCGNDWTIVAEDLFSPALDEGLSWLMVDYHTVPEAAGGGLSLAQEQEMGVRPYWIVIPQRRVLGVDYDKVGDVYVINMFRYYTSVKVRDGQFGQKSEDQIRVVEPHQISIYTQDANGDWVLKETPLINTLGMVPIHPLNLQKKGAFEAHPPLANLADMNLEHFQIRSDQRRALSVASFPILGIFGVDSKGAGVRIGPMTSFTFEEEKANMKWIESNGAHLLAGDRELVRLESDIRAFGLAFETPGMYATATGRNIDASDQVAPIIRWAYRLRDAINAALYFHAKWRKLESGGTVNVDTSFLQNMLTIEALKLLVEAFKAGALTPEAFLNRLKDYGILANDFDVEGDVKKSAELALQKAEQAIKEMEAKAAPSPGGNEPPSNGEIEA